MARPKRRDDRPIPAHPYRDTAVVYGVMAVLLVVVASLTGGDLVRAILVALVFFVIATAWSWWKFHGRIKEREAASAAATSDASSGGRANGNGRGSVR